MKKRNLHHLFALFLLTATIWLVLHNLHVYSVHGVSVGFSEA